PLDAPLHRARVLRSALTSSSVTLVIQRLPSHSPFFSFTDRSRTAPYTLSLHDALPIYSSLIWDTITDSNGNFTIPNMFSGVYDIDRKSTRLNSSHLGISYAVFCLKKKKKTVTYETVSVLPVVPGLVVAAIPDVVCGSVH